MDSNRTLYEGLLEKLKEAGVTAGLRSNNFRIIDAARVPTAPSEPNIPRNLSFALVLGIISGLGLLDIWIGISEAIHYRDHRR